MPSIKLIWYCSIQYSVVMGAILHASDIEPSSATNLMWVGPRLGHIQIGTPTHGKVNWLNVLIPLAYTWLEGGNKGQGNLHISTH